MAQKDKRGPAGPAEALLQKARTIATLATVWEAVAEAACKPSKGKSCSYSSQGNAKLIRKGNVIIALLSGSAVNNNYIIM